MLTAHAELWTPGQSLDSDTVTPLETKPRKHITLRQQRQHMQRLTYSWPWNVVRNHSKNVLFHCKVRSLGNSVKTREVVSIRWLIPTLHTRHSL